MSAVTLEVVATTDNRRMIASVGSGVVEVTMEDRDNDMTTTIQLDISAMRDWMDMLAKLIDTESEKGSAP